MRKLTSRFGSRVGAALACIVVVVAIAGIACSQGSEGDRCNPDLAAGESECNAGLKCLQPDLCPESYCCPVAAGGVVDPNCQKGCNGGAASICNSGQDDGGACAFACENDPSDLVNASTCSMTARDAGSGTSKDAGPGSGDAHAD